MEDSLAIEKKPGHSSGQDNLVLVFLHDTCVYAIVEFAMTKSHVHSFNYTK